MGVFSYYENTIDGDVYVQKLTSYIKRNEEALANGLLFYSKNKKSNSVKSLRLPLTTHHLYFLCEKIDSSNLGVDVGALNIKLDNPNHEPTFISFLANNARSAKHFDSDTRSISSIGSMRSIVSTASVYWRSISFSKDPRVIQSDLKYLYSSFTKIPCLVLSPKTKVNNIAAYEEYPCDTSVPIKMFKNLQVLEIAEYEPNEIYGWNILSDQLRILIIRCSKVNDLSDILFNLVIEDECGRSSFSISKNNMKKSNEPGRTTNDDYSFSEHIMLPPPFKRYSRRRATTSGAGSTSRPFGNPESNSSKGNIDNEVPKDYTKLPEGKWSMLKQLSVTETAIVSIKSYIFKPFTNLVKLNLSNNLLEKIPPGLDYLSSLRYLNLSDNYIKDLENIPTKINKLVFLNLNNNKIESLEGLELLLTLEKIDLRRNELKKIEDLKPLVRLYKEGPQKLNSIYLFANKLPKTYRIDLFNLINGIKYKNEVKIDDSRPGYFESTSLLDAESAVLEVSRFLELIPVSKGEVRLSSSIPSGINCSEFPSELAEKIANLNLQRSAESKVLSINIGELASQMTAIPQTPDEGSHVAASYEHPLPPSPLYPNQRVTNQASVPDTSIRAKPYHSISMASSTSNLSAHLPKGSITATIPQLDSPKSNSAAPGVITPIQVTARMST